MVACLIVIQRGAVACHAFKCRVCVDSAARLAALRVLPVGGCLYVTINRGFNTGSDFICRLRDAFAMDACLVRLYREPEHRWLTVLTLGA